MSFPGAKTFLSKDIVGEEELKNYKVVRTSHLTPEVLKEIATPHMTGQYHIANVIFTEPLSLDKISHADITLQNCFLEQSISSWHPITFKGNVYFDRCYFTKGLTFMSGITFEKKLLMMNVCASNILIQDARFKNASLYCDDVTYIQFTKAVFDTFLVRAAEKKAIECLKIDCGGLEGSLVIDGADTGAIYDVVIRGGSKLLELTIEDLSIHRIGFFRFFNGTGLKLFNIKAVLANIPSEFTIADCNLGKAEFYSVDLGNFQLVCVFDSYLLDCTFVGTKWPQFFHYFEYSFFGTIETFYQKRYEHVTKMLTEAMRGNVGKRLPFYPDIYNDQTTLEKLKETFRQIKYSYTKQGDSQMEHKFHVLEMRYQNRLLYFRKEPLQKLILPLSDWSSEFGQSIKRPLVGLLWGHLFLFIVLIISHGTPLIMKPSLTFSDINKTVFWFFKLINPIHSNDLPANATIIIDLTMRIWSSYMIYNFIKASRRYIR